jgi:hypothetical protein
MTYGTFANTYLVGRRPSRSSPHRRSRSVRSARTGDPAHGKGTYSTHGALCALLFGLPCSKTSRARDQLRLRSRKTSHPPRQDAQINYLAILAIFVKQRTYLATLLFIWPPCPYLAILPCPIAPPRQRNSKKTKRNLFCATPLRLPHDLVRLLRFLRTFLHGLHPSPGVIATRMLYDAMR